MSKTWKKRILCLTMLIVGLAIIASGTAAYFVAEETSYNVITTGLIAMKLVEEAADGKPWTGGAITNVVPATAVDKVVYVKNEGTAPFYTRIQLAKVIIPAPGVTEELSVDMIHLDIDTRYWTEMDGFYYYNEAVDVRGKTEPLFTKVSFAPEMGNEYMNATVKILMQAQAVQSDNNDDGGPLMALGWSEAANLLEDEE